MTGSCPSGTLNLSEGALSGFEVVVSCTSSTHEEAGNTRESLTIASQASFGSAGSPDYVYREMMAAIILDL